MNITFKKKNSGEYYLTSSTWSIFLKKVSVIRIFSESILYGSEMNAIEEDPIDGD